jgi:hypothetical protein
MFRRGLGWLLGSLAVLASPTWAQDTRTSIAMAAGSATDVAGTSSNALSISPMMVTTGANSMFSLSGNGTRFTNHAWSASLAAALSSRAGMSAVAPTIDLGAAGALTSYSFSYVTADATPALEARIGSARIFGGTHLGSASTSGTIQSQSVQSLANPVTPASTTTRTTATAVGGGAMIFDDGSGQSVSLTYRGEYGTVAGAHQTDHTVSIAVGNENVGVSGSIGRQVDPGTAATFGSASLAIGVTRNIVLQFAAGSYAANRMLATPGGQFVNAGMTVRFGGVAPVSLPHPAGVAPPASGMTRLSIVANDAASVEVTGDFNQWEFIRTEHASNGVWYADLRLPAGQYRYAFRIDGKEWRIPAGVSAAADDEFGGKSAWLTVTPAVGGHDTW